MDPQQPDPLWIMLLMISVVSFTGLFLNLIFGDAPKESTTCKLHKWEHIEGIGHKCKECHRVATTETTPGDY